MSLHFKKKTAHSVTYEISFEKLEELFLTAVKENNFSIINKTLLIFLNTIFQGRCDSNFFSQFVNRILKMVNKTDPASAKVFFEQILNFIKKEEGSVESYGFAEMLLIVAANEGNVIAIESLLSKFLTDLKRHYSLTDAHKFLDQLLIDAVEKGHLAVVEYLLSMKANVNATKENGETLLHLAVKNDHIDMVNALLAVNPDLINILDKDGATALYFAAKNGATKTARFLLKAETNPEKYMPFAIKNKDINVIGFLLNENIGINAIIENDNALPLCPQILGYMAKQGNARAVVELLRLVDVNQSSYLGRNALEWAAFCGHEKIVIELLNAGALVDASVSGQTPLSLAATNGHIKIVYMLLNRNADPNIKGPGHLLDNEFAAPPVLFTQEENFASSNSSDAGCSAPEVNEVSNTSCPKPVLRRSSSSNSSKTPRCRKLCD